MYVVNVYIYCLFYNLILIVVCLFLFFIVKLAIDRY
jgi:hypothetical protein